MEKKRECTATPCDDDGYVCSNLKCGCYCCRSCVKAFVALISETCKNVVDDPVVLSNGKFLEDPSFSPECCHVCYFGMQRDQVEEDHRRYIEECNKPLEGDGHLVMAQFGFGTDSLDGHKEIVDVHGMGSEDLVEFVWHQVVSVEEARVLSETRTVGHQLPGFGESSSNVHRLEPILE